MTGRWSVDYAVTARAHVAGEPPVETHWRFDRSDPWAIHLGIVEDRDGRGRPTGYAQWLLSREVVVAGLTSVLMTPVIYCQVAAWSRRGENGSTFHLWLLGQHPAGGDALALVLAFPHQVVAEFARACELAEPLALAHVPTQRATDEWLRTLTGGEAR